MKRTVKVANRHGTRLLVAAISVLGVGYAREADSAELPRYDHVVVVIEENKDYGQVIDSDAAPYINGTLKAEGADLTQMYAEEHKSEGNYFWLLSGSNQQVGFDDEMPTRQISASNLAQCLIGAGLTFKGYSEGLPEIGSTASIAGLYAR